MIISQGSTVTVSAGGDNVVTGVLAEEISVQAGTTYKELLPTINDEIANAALAAIDIVGSITRHYTGRGFSSKFKWQTSRIWDKTNPITISLNIEFNRQCHNTNVCSNRDATISSANVIGRAKRLCAMVAPTEGTGGNLIPPGPSVQAALGWSFIQNLGNIPEEQAESHAPSAGPTVDTNRLLTITAGGLTFSNMIMTRADPTFSRYRDTEGRPIFCRVACTFESMHVATTDMINAW